MFDSLAGWLSNDLAIDLGTANTLVYAQGQGAHLLRAVASSRSRRIRAAAATRCSRSAHEAKEMLGRTPGSIRAVRPIKDGVIADFEITEAMLRYFIRQAHNRRRIVRPRIVICVPPCITSVEKRAVRESAISAGAREVFLIEEPMAAAIGAGLDVTAPTGNMVVDIGGGTTDVAVISLSGIVTLALDPLRRRQDGRGDHQLREAQVQHADRRAHRRGRQDGDRHRVADREDRDDGDQGPRPRRRHPEGRGRDQRGDPRGAVRADRADRRDACT